jgi:peptide/nickel transport system substrate-binding protein
VTFHDGTPLDAAAVVASFERILDPATAAPGRFVVTSIDEVRAVDASTVELVTDPPFAPLLAHLAHPVAAIVPVALAGPWREPVGTGPFRSCAGWTAARSCSPRTTTTGAARRPSREVVVRIIPEVSTQIVELRSGGVDMIFNLPADNYLSLPGTPRSSPRAGPAGAAPTSA